MKKALIIVDMQNDFLGVVLGNERCLATVPVVVDLIKNGDYNCLVYTQDTHDEDYLSTQEGKRLPVAHCIRGSEGWKLNQQVQDAIDEYTAEGRGCVFSMEKNTFGGLVLIDILNEDVMKECEEIHFCGVCTGICVISNVIITKATLPETRLCVIDKACACVTDETHNVAESAMRTCQVDII